MAINFNQVGFTYQLNTPFATPGLHDVNFTMPEGKFTAVIGHTGSGKSTMVQHLDGLVIPTAGEITIGEQRIVPTTKPKELNQMRAHVGLVFQFPEAQLFEQTVLKDVMFGLRTLVSRKLKRKKLPNVPYVRWGWLNDSMSVHRLNCLVVKCDVSPLLAFWQWNRTC